MGNKNIITYKLPDLENIYIYIYIYMTNKKTVELQNKIKLN